MKYLVDNLNSVFNFNVSDIEPLLQMFFETISRREVVLMNKTVMDYRHIVYSF